MSAQWTDSFLDAMRQKADPAADEAVGLMIRQGGIQSARKIFDQLIRQLEIPVADLPFPLQDFVRAHQTLPTWADLSQSKMAHDLFIDHGPKFLLLLYFKALPLLYTDHKGAKVLAHTSRLIHEPTSMEIFSRRIAETGQFLLFVMRQNAFTLPLQDVNIILKVRLIHAAIRQFIQLGKWDQENLGVPINQEDLALTLMTFSIALTEGLSQLGIYEREERMVAYQHHWNIVGNLMGIDESILPRDLASARYLLHRILQRQSAPSEDGRILTRALLRFSEEAIPGERLDISAEVLIRYLLGKEKAGMLGLKEKPGCIGWLALLLMRLGFSTAESWEDRSENIHYRADQLSKVLIQAMVGYFLKYKDQPFKIPEEFAHHWMK